MAKKKRYTYFEVMKLMKEKYGEKNAPYVTHTTNYEPDMKYRVQMVYYRTLLEIVEAYGLD